jgi:tRNA1(Val) A37 N6-methylase TrmN6
MRTVGTAFERQLPARERTLLGQFYTPRPVADLLVALTLDPTHLKILDPGCGAGELLLSAYDHLAARGHPDPLSTLAGIDINPAAAALAARALSNRDPRATPDITTGDFFARPATPTWDCILANPPYVRSQHQDAHDPAARARLFAAAARVGVDADAKTDLFAFFLYQAISLLKFGGRLGFITPATWLTSRCAHALQRILTGPLRLTALVASTAESFIPHADIHTVLLIADRTDVDTPLKFVTLCQPLSAFASPAALAGEIRARAHSYEDARLRVHVLPSAATPTNWSRLLRAPLSHDLLLTRPAFTTVDALARVALGYKSLQNDFYYVTPPTISQYAIEPRYLQPIHMLRDLDAATHAQSSAPRQHIFLCRDAPAPGALAYITAMAPRPAARRKQSSSQQTIRDALAAQGGTRWYAPKARPRAAHIWLRKAIDGVHAPFLFTDPAVVDQRCNSLTPRPDVPWPLLAALVTTSLFAFAVETHGSASLGAGALEATTTHINHFPIFDPRPLGSSARDELVALARAVWTHESPIDWRAPDIAPGPHLRALDTWLLARSGADLALDRLYTDLRATCRARIAVARAR